MGYGRGVKMGLAEPVDFLSEADLATRGTKTGLATPVHVINAIDFEGDSAYEIAVANGFVGTEAEWLASLVGPPGSGGDLFYIHNQLSVSSVWTVTHNLGKFPSATIVDSAGTVVIGDIAHINNNQLTITFNAPFSGRAYIN